MDKNIIPATFKPHMMDIGDIKDGMSFIRTGDEFSFHCPATGGYGVVRVALMVPDNHVLFVIPQGCGRHGVISSYLFGDKKRLHSLYVNEADLSLGTHLNHVYGAVEKILRLYNIKTLAIIYSCIDDILGSDFEAVAEEIEEKFGVRVRVGAMNPIRCESKKPPLVTILKTAYSFADKMVTNNADYINIVGNFCQIDQDSEIHELLKESCGIKLLHMTQCENFDQYEDLISRSRLNLLVHDAGLLATKDLKSRLNIPFLRFPMHLRQEDIVNNYESLAACLNTQFNYKPYMEKYSYKASEQFEQLRGMYVSIGSSNNIYPFETARILEENGVHVSAIFTSFISNVCKQHISWLKENAPHIKVVPPDNRTAMFLNEHGIHSDVAIGLDAAYYSSCDSYIEAGFENQLFGFVGLCSLLDKLLSPKKIDNNFEDLLYKSTLVI